MKHIMYTGQSDALELGPADFEKAGVDSGREIRFEPGTSVEVNEQIAKALLGNEGVFEGWGDFFREATDDEVEASQRAAATPDDSSEETDSGVMTETGHEGQDASGETTTSSGTRGRGRSTATS